MKHFNGGDVFAPVTLFYGIRKDIDYSFTEINNSRMFLSIPFNYYIIAKHNDEFICLNFAPPFDVIQWDNLKK